MKTINEYINDCKEKNGFKKDVEVARFLGISTAAMSGIRKGGGLNDKNLMKIKNNLNVEIEEILLANIATREKNPIFKKALEKISQLAGITTGITLTIQTVMPLDIIKNCAFCILCKIQKTLKYKNGLNFATRIIFKDEVKKMAFQFLYTNAGFKNETETAEFFKVTKKTITNWKKNKPPHAVYLCLKLMAGELEPLNKKWKGFKLLQNCIISPEGNHIWHYEINSLNYVYQIAGIERTHHCLVINRENTKIENLDQKLVNTDKNKIDNIILFDKRAIQKRNYASLMCQQQKEKA